MYKKAGFARLATSPVRCHMITCTLPHHLFAFDVNVLKPLKFLLAHQSTEYNPRRTPERKKMKISTRLYTAVCIWPAADGASAVIVSVPVPQTMTSEPTIHRLRQVIITKTMSASRHSPMSMNFRFSFTRVAPRNARQLCGCLGHAVAADFTLQMHDHIMTGLIGYSFSARVCLFWAIANRSYQLLTRQPVRDVQTEWSMTSVYFLTPKTVPMSLPSSSNFHHVLTSRLQ